jgi:hypothetical protein
MWVRGTSVPLTGVYILRGSADHDDPRIKYGEKLNAVSLLTLSGGGNIQYRGGAPALVFNQG